MTDYAKLQKLATDWLSDPAALHDGLEEDISGLTKMFAAVAADARREALMEAAAICKATVKLRMRDGSYLPGGMTAHELAARICALADTPRADAERE